MKMHTETTLEINGEEYWIEIDAITGLAVTLSQIGGSSAWKNEFSEAYIEDMTNQAGFAQTFSTFCELLLEAVGGKKKTCIIDLLTSEQVNALRTDIDAKNRKNIQLLKKRYLILTFTSEFGNTCSYPLSLPFLSRSTQKPHILMSPKQTEDSVLHSELSDVSFSEEEEEEEEVRTKKTPPQQRARRRKIKIRELEENEEEEEEESFLSENEDGFEITEITSNKYKQILSEHKTLTLQIQTMEENAVAAENDIEELKSIIEKRNQEIEILEKNQTHTRIRELEMVNEDLDDQILALKKSHRNKLKKNKIERQELEDENEQLKRKIKRLRQNVSSSPAHFSRRRKTPSPITNYRSRTNSQNRSRSNLNASKKRSLSSSKKRSRSNLNSSKNNSRSNLHSSKKNSKRSLLNASRSRSPHIATGRARSASFGKSNRPRFDPSAWVRERDKKIEKARRLKKRSESPALRNRSSKSVGSRIRSSSARRRKDKPPIPVGMKKRSKKKKFQKDSMMSDENDFEKEGHRKDCNLKKRTDKKRMKGTLESDLEKYDITRNAMDVDNRLNALQRILQQAKQNAI